MRKNVKKQLALRVLSTAALMAMVSSIATAAFADTYDLNTGSVTVKTKDDGVTYVTQKDDKQEDGFARNKNNEILNEHPDDTGVTITSGGKKTSNTITVETAKDQTTDVTLENVHIEVNTTKAKTGAIEIKGDGDTNLELDGDNTVLVKNEWSEEHAAIEKADKYGTGTLTIKDDVNDNGTEKSGTEADTTGKLLAGGYHNSAAIGGGSNTYNREYSLADTSNITITGGDITAIAGCDGAAAIGGGCSGTGKNIRIEGNAHVIAASEDGAAIGGGFGSGNSVTITDDAVVDAYSAFAAAIGNGDQVGCSNDPTTITISGNATVHAETRESGCAIGTSRDGSLSDLTINIEENANVTAIASYDRPAIGNAGCHDDTTTTINITGGTVNAINSFGCDDPEYSSQYDGTGDYSPAIGGRINKWSGDGDFNTTCNVNINSSTGDTVVNAYIYGKGSAPAVGSGTETTSYNPYKVEYQYVPADSASYKADGSSYFGESNSAIVNCYNNGSVAKEKLELPRTLDPYTHNRFKYRHTIAGGTLTKVVHNRKYMDENPNIDTKKLEDEDLHDWKLVGKVVEPTTEKDGYADYICSIDKCGQTKHVVLPKIVPDTPSTPETPDTPDTPSTPDTPNKPDTPSTPDVPSTPEVTPADPAVTPDAVQADAAPADAAVTPAAVQNVVQDAKPEAAATAAVSAAALPQTGANWLAVAGSALSGLFLLAVGFVLDRKGRRMN